MNRVRAYADGGDAARPPIERAGLPRYVLADLRHAGWIDPYVVQLIPDGADDN